MALPTQGFSVRALPTAPTIPGQVGVVQPLDPARVAQLAVQLRAAAQNESIRNQEAMNADNAARQNIVLARAAESRKQQAFPLEQQSATLENQGRAQNIAQGAESFATGASQRALLAKQAEYQQARVGPTDTSKTTTFHPETGLYETNNVQTANGQRVSSDRNVTPLMPGATAAAQSLKPAVVFDIHTGEQRGVLRNIRGDYIDPETKQPVDFEHYTLNAPTKAAVAGAVASAVGEAKAPFVGQTALSKEDAKFISEYPDAIGKIAVAKQGAGVLSRLISDAQELAKDETNTGNVGHVAASAYNGPARQLRANLDAVRGAIGQDVLTNVKNVRSQAEYNNLTNMLGSLDANKQTGQQLINTLSQIDRMRTVLLDAEQNALEQRHQQALQRLSKYASAPEDGGAGGQGAGSPPPEAISMLKADPSPQAQAEFDAAFGPGAAARYR